MTEWRPVPGYEGLYQVSDVGQVFSSPRATTRGGILKRFSDGHGYPSITLTKDGVQKRFGAHQLVALAFIGPCPPGQEVRHRDGDKTNPAVTNLEYGTHWENVQDTMRHGRNPNAAKTHCPAGHPYDKANTTISGGRRYCRECAQTAYRRRIST